MYCRELFESFLEACSNLPDIAFKNKINNRFNVALYESVFTVVCEKAFAERRVVAGEIDIECLQALEKDKEFAEASRASTTDTSNVHKRLNRARELVGGAEF